MKSITICDSTEIGLARQIDYLKAEGWIVAFSAPKKHSGFIFTHMEKPL